jgi:predicted HTH transcriptional regulator
VYDQEAVAALSQVMTLPTAEDEVTEADIDQANPEQFARMMEELYGTRETWALPLERLMAGEESDVVEFKTSARWDTDGQVTKKAPAVITKTIAGFANAKGGTLLIGVNDGGGAVGLKPDYDTFSERQNIDKWLNWLTDIIINHLGRGVMRRIRVRIEFVEDKEICRIDIPALSAPTWSAAGKGYPVLYERLPNSTRAVPEPEVDDFLRERFGG